MEMRVYFAGKPPSCAAIDGTLAQIGLPFRITEPVSLENHSGYLPMTYGEGDDALETGTGLKRGQLPFSQYGCCFNHLNQIGNCP